MLELFFNIFFFKRFLKYMYLKYSYFFFLFLFLFYFYRFLFFHTSYVSFFILTISLHPLPYFQFPISVLVFFFAPPFPYFISIPFSFPFSYHSLFTIILIIRSPLCTLNTQNFIFHPTNTLHLRLTHQQPSSSISEPPRNHA